MNGVLGARVDAEAGDAFIEYDLSKCREEAIEHWMEKNGFVLDDAFFERVKRGWIRFTEENEVEAMQAVPRPLSGFEEEDED